jgi:hypothetical protein
MHMLCSYDCRPLLAPKVDVHPRCFYQMVDQANSKNYTIPSDIQIIIFLSCQEVDLALALDSGKKVDLKCHVQAVNYVNRISCIRSDRHNYSRTGLIAKNYQEGIGAFKMSKIIGF